jgi:hypothetical protein
VRIEALEESDLNPPRASAEAIMAAVNSGAHFQGDPAEWDPLLAELKEGKQVESKAQLDAEPVTPHDEP